MCEREKDKRGNHITRRTEEQDVEHDERRTVEKIQASRPQLRHHFTRHTATSRHNSRDNAINPAAPRDARMSLTVRSRHLQCTTAVCSDISCIFQ